MNQPLPKMNVQESWPLYDTIVICPEFYGSEDQNRGWFNNMIAFSNLTEHSLLNQRTQATAGLCYCNKDTADSLDFPYHIYSVGVAFVAPGVRVMGEGPAGLDSALTQANTQFNHWWETVMPTHCSLELKVQQDVVLELPSLAASPGYGPNGTGASFQHALCGQQGANGFANDDYLPVMNMSVTQGVPTIKNRWSMADAPIGVPRTGTVEAIIKVSEIARYYLARWNMDPHYFFRGATALQDFTQFPARYLIQVSLLGYREVQQRAAYFA